MLLQRAGLTARERDVKPARVDSPRGDDILGSQSPVSSSFSSFSETEGLLPNSTRVGLASWVVDKDVEDVLWGFRKKAA